MKLKEVVDAFEGLTIVYDSISNFSRKWDLVPAYKEVKEMVELHNNDRNKLITKYKNDKGEMLRENASEFTKEYNAMIEHEIKLKHKLRFTKKEVEDSKIEGSKLVNIIEFISS